MPHGSTGINPRNVIPLGLVNVNCVSIRVQFLNFAHFLVPPPVEGEGLVDEEARIHGNAKNILRS